MPSEKRLDRFGWTNASSSGAVHPCKDHMSTGITSLNPLGNSKYADFMVLTILKAKRDRINRMTAKGRNPRRFRAC
jgi:hypothetical protein